MGIQISHLIPLPVQRASILLLTVLLWENYSWIHIWICDHYIVVCVFSGCVPWGSKSWPRPSSLSVSRCHGRCIYHTCVEYKLPLISGLAFKYDCFPLCFRQRFLVVFMVQIPYGTFHGPIPHQELLIHNDVLVVLTQLVSHACNSHYYVTVKVLLFNRECNTCLLWQWHMGRPWSVVMHIPRYSKSFRTGLYTMTTAKCYKYMYIHSYF